eukprot:scaffold232955_cov15-Tisochrysis_lutea.AAC.1
MMGCSGWAESLDAILLWSWAWCRCWCRKKKQWHSIAKFATLLLSEERPGPTLICASQNNDCRWSQKEQRVVGRVTRVTIQELQW